MSTAYSGSTARRATTVSASARGMSCSEASAAHEMAKAAPTMPAPKRSVDTSVDGERPAKRIRNAGTAASSARATAMAQLIVGCPLGQDSCGSWVRLRRRSGLDVLGPVAAFLVLVRGSLFCSAYRPRPVAHYARPGVGRKSGRATLALARPRPLWSVVVGRTAALRGRWLLPSGTPSFAL